MASILKVNEIQHTGGTSALSFASDGTAQFQQYYVPNNRWIAIEKNGNQSVTGGASTGLNTWTVTGSNGLTWNGTNHRLDITSATAGTYYIIFQLSAYSGSNNVGDIRARVRKNGTIEFGAYNLLVSGSTSGDPFDVRHYTVASSGIVTVADGDNIDFNCLIQGSSPFVFAGDGEGPRATNAFIQQIG